MSCEEGEKEASGATHGKQYVISGVVSRERDREGGLMVEKMARYVL